MPRLSLLFVWGGCTAEIAVHDTRPAPHLSPSPLWLPPTDDCDTAALEVVGGPLLDLGWAPMSGDPEAVTIPPVAGEVSVVELGFCVGEEPVSGLLTAVFEHHVAHVWVEEE